MQLVELWPDEAFQSVESGDFGVNQLFLCLTICIPAPYFDVCSNR